MAYVKRRFVIVAFFFFFLFFCWVRPLAARSEPGRVPPELVELEAALPKGTKRSTGASSCTSRAKAALRCPLKAGVPKGKR